MYPSTNWSTGPIPFTRFSLIIVTGISASVKNLEEYPPPLKYPLSAAFHVVAASIASWSASFTSNQGFIIPFPFSSFAWPLASKQDAPEFIKCINPSDSFATPSSSYPVAFLTASGDQYVRTSENICGVLVNNFPNSILIPLRTSFSVART